MEAAPSRFRSALPAAMPKKADATLYAVKSERMLLEKAAGNTLAVSRQPTEAQPQSESESGRAPDMAEGAAAGAQRDAMLHQRLAVLQSKMDALDAHEARVAEGRRRQAMQALCGAWGGSGAQRT